MTEVKLPRLVPPDTRLVQALIIAHNHVPTNSPDHALTVFNIPEDEYESFVPWLGHLPSPDISDEEKVLYRAKQLLLQRMRTSGFVKHNSRKTLQQIANAYRTEVNSSSRINWYTVPMIPGSIVLFCGIHCVRGGTTRRAMHTCRTVLYLNPWSSTTRKALSVKDNHTTLYPSRTHYALEEAISTLYNKQGLHYGINADTVPVAYHGMYVDNGQQEESPICDTETMQQLRRDGFVVLKDCLTPAQSDELHQSIEQILKEVLVCIPRHGQSDTKRNYIMSMNNDTLANNLYRDVQIRNARYFRNQSTAQYKPDADEAAPDAKRLCLRGVKGITSSSGMIDIFEHPAFIKVHMMIHARLKKELGVAKLFFGPERCGIRAYKSTELPPHQDEPLLSNICVSK